MNDRFFQNRTIVFLALATMAMALPLFAQQNEPGNFDPSTRPAKTQRTADKYKSHSPRDDQAHFTSADLTAGNPHLPTLFIAGDSTAAPGDPDHRGWGAVLVDYFDTSKINLVNRAVGGRSFRTFYGEGKWKQIVDALKPGDFVIIEFGHNDGGGANAATGRGDVPGIGDDTVEVTKRDGTKETVHSFGWYLRTFIHDVKAKQATPIVSSPTVRDTWPNGKIERSMGKYAGWEQQIASQEKVTFFDHTNSTADLLEKMGQTEAAKNYPNLPRDGTHTSTEGAILNARTIVANIKATPSLPLANDLNEKAKDIEPYTAPASTAPAP